MSDNISSEARPSPADKESEAPHGPPLADHQQEMILQDQSLHELMPSDSRRELGEVRGIVRENEEQGTSSRNSSNENGRKQTYLEGEQELESTSESSVPRHLDDDSYLSTNPFNRTSNRQLMEEDSHDMEDDIYGTREDDSDPDRFEELVPDSFTPTVRRRKAQYRPRYHHHRPSGLSRSMSRQQQLASGWLPESSTRAEQRASRSLISNASSVGNVNGETSSDLIGFEQGRSVGEKSTNVDSGYSHNGSDTRISGLHFESQLSTSGNNNTTSNSHRQAALPSVGTPGQQLDRPLSSISQERSNEMGNAISSHVIRPIWQSDSEVEECPICEKSFNFFSRKHHCRKCGRVVCNACSPHRITIPYQYIVQPPTGADDCGLEHVRTRSRTISQSSIHDPDIAGGMKVRLCNPCVPDPNTSPHTLPLTLDRPLPPLPPSRSPPHPPQPPARTSSNRQRVQRSELCPVCGDRLPPSTLAIENHIDRCINRQLRGHSNERHINTFTPRPSEQSHSSSSLPLTSHTTSHMNRPRHTSEAATLGNSQNASRNASSSSRATPEAAPSRPFLCSRMICFTATKIDTVGQDSECIICMEDFEEGVEMARLECLCKYHKKCIDGWFFAHPGRCPVHGQDNY